MEGGRGGREGGMGEGRVPLQLGRVRRPLPHEAARAVLPAPSRRRTWWGGNKGGVCVWGGVLCVCVCV
jgi:hypothetical protein